MQSKAEELLGYIPRHSIIEAYLQNSSFLEEASKVVEAWNLAERLLEDFKTKYPIDMESRSWAIYGSNPVF